MRQRRKLSGRNRGRSKKSDKQCERRSINESYLNISCKYCLLKYDV